MADWRLDQKTEETPQGTDLSLLVRGTSVFKTTFQKIKEFIIGTTVMGTTATDVTGAVKELNDKIGSEEKEGSIISQLNDITKTYDDLIPIVPDEGFTLDTSNINGYFKINGDIVKVWFSIKSNTIKEANTWVKITTLAFCSKLNTGGFAVASDNVNIKPFIYSGCSINKNGELYVYGDSQWNSIKGYIEFLLK